MLFNLTNDPHEQNDLSASQPDAGRPGHAAALGLGARNDVDQPHQYRPDDDCSAGGRRLSYERNPAFLPAQAAGNRSS